jgi:F0F1-type ATP synthase assembly protein I
MQDKYKDTNKNTNKNKFIMAPSYYALAVTGVLLLLNIFIIIKNFKKITTERPYNLIILITAIGLLAGIHGILHLGLEKVYNYNPIQFIQKKIFNRKQINNK